MCHPNRYYFAFLCSWLYLYGVSKHKFFVWEEQLMKILRFIFIGNQEKNYGQFLALELCECNTGRLDLSRISEGKVIKPIF